MMRQIVTFPVKDHGSMKYPIMAVVYLTAQVSLSFSNFSAILQQIKHPAFPSYAGERRKICCKKTI